MDLALHDPGEFLQKFRKIRTGIYDAPDDFVIKHDADKSPSFEPVDEELWKACAGSSVVTHFTLDRVYEALQTSEKCNHIWALFERIFLITRKSKKEEICSIRPGLYRAPSDLVIMRTNRQALIGGCSYKLISRSVQSDCERLYALDRVGDKLRLAEIYAGLWILGGYSRSIFSEMSVIMRGWLRNEEFSISEEGMLTRLVLQLGQLVKTQGIANLIRGRVVEGKYLMTGLLRDGGDHWYAKCQSLDSPHRWEQPRATLRELVDALC
ncbi:hypothetical protein E8E15_000886 [Penicillium rubens]|nr:hypothetical protein E8E15_000886 [Penicillium rubens]